MELDTKFPRYTQFDPKVPVWCVTPNRSGCIHRFFDVTNKPIRALPRGLSIAVDALIHAWLLACPANPIIVLGSSDRAHPAASPQAISSLDAKTGLAYGSLQKGMGSLD